MQAAAEQLRINPTVTTEQAEETIIVFGKQTWPYREAFAEFVELYEGLHGEVFFRQSISPILQKKYDDFLAYGGSYRDLYQGKKVHFFSPEDRQELCGALVNTRLAIREHARQAALSTERSVYEAKILEFQEVLDDIEKRLDALRLEADNEQEHPDLAAEIRAQVRAFEYGLCALGPKTDYTAVCAMPEHVAGRRKEKKMRVAHASYTK